MEMGEWRSGPRGDWTRVVASISDERMQKLQFTNWVLVVKKYIGSAFTCGRYLNDGTKHPYSDAFTPPLKN